MSPRERDSGPSRPEKPAMRSQAAPSEPISDRSRRSASFEPARGEYPGWGERLRGSAGTVEPEGVIHRSSDGRRRAPSRGTTIATLIACHDRRDTTLACLESLEAQQWSDEWRQEAFVVDDGSTDGTSEAILARFPNTRMEKGHGSLFWCGGMRRALRAANEAPERFDFFLWLKDDVQLLPDAIERLLATYRELSRTGRRDLIIVGSTLDPETGQLSYGGQRQLRPWPLLALVEPRSEPTRCMTMNGNCVLVPRDVSRLLGIIEPRLVHLGGDLDYGLRASAAGVGVWLAPGHHGFCKVNRDQPWRNTELPLVERLAAFKLQRFSLEEKSFVARRHFGLMGWLVPLAHYLYVLVTHVVALFHPRKAGAG